ncbi:MAG: FkbM family methyltransferase [Candidatus Babeliales bacterium]|nr:FkbM family methyltransferase [Candidatus Babeliales bacterium]
MSYFCLIFLILIFNISSLDYNFFSQFGQDRYVFEHFKNKKNGIFIEMGGSDGITNSNTYFFEKYLNWKGICIEPVEYLFKQLIKNRKSINLNCAVWKIDGYASFIETQLPGEKNLGWSGLIDTYDQRHKDELVNFWQKIHNCIVKETKIYCRQFNNICKEYEISHIDFLSIDTEGSELDIIKTIDFEKILIDIITVEDNFNDTSITEFLKTKGFDFIIRLGVDNIYKNKRLT